jgi:hypothetical protein
LGAPVFDRDLHAQVLSFSIVIYTPTVFLRREGSMADFAMDSYVQDLSPTSEQSRWSAWTQPNDLDGDER